MFYTYTYIIMDTNNNNNTLHLYIAHLLHKIYACSAVLTKLTRKSKIHDNVLRNDNLNKYKFENQIIW